MALDAMHGQWKCIPLVILSGDFQKLQAAQTNVFLTICLGE
jgi:hypothetical protein